MPAAAYHECRFPRCPNYAVHHGYCATHASSDSNRRNPEPGNLNPGNARFRRLRHFFLVKHPMCNACKREPATILDHVIPHRGISPLFWSQNNWQGLCVHCHGVKTAREVHGHEWARYQ
jgi:5-methylcytosine-specific restriction protein A